MRRITSVPLLTLLLCMTFKIGWAANPCSFPDARIPDGIGINLKPIPHKAEIKEIAAAGFRWIRLDFHWDGIERSPGKYDFSAFDRFLKEIAPFHLRALFTLDYSNPLYDHGLSPYAPEGVAAFARWAAAAAQHFKGHGILWEMYNEPNNLGFWRPKPDINHYITLALAVGKAIKAVAPNEYYIGPATARVDLNFLKACFQAGLLNYWDAVTVHPYRFRPPETVAADYAQLRSLITQYAPQHKSIPIFDGEWGYSDVFTGVSGQAGYLARQWLINLENGVYFSIWYDGHDDGVSPHKAEEHYGIMLHDYHPDHANAFTPKPAYYAAKHLISVLYGFTFDKRVALDSSNDYCLVFKNGHQFAYALWTTDEPHDVTFSLGPATYVCSDTTGQSSRWVRVQTQLITVHLTQSPIYLKSVVRD